MVSEILAKSAPGSDFKLRQSLIAVLACGAWIMRADVINSIGAVMQQYCAHSTKMVRYENCFIQLCINQGTKTKNILTRNNVFIHKNFIMSLL